MNDTTVLIDIGALEERLDESSRGRRHVVLTFLSGAELGNRIRLEESRSYTLGRNEACDVRLDEPSVSRTHATVTIAGDGQEILLCDCGSSNGTFVDGRRLSPREARVVRAGSKIVLGDRSVLRVDLQDELDAHFQASLYEAAVKDGLTGAFNKRYLLENLGRELALAQRHGVPLSLVIFDIDHFKKINDTYGHLAGDYVLASVAQIVQRALRAEDLFARYGGEEFVVVAKHQGLQAAAQLAERIRVLIEEADVRFDGERIPVTVSVGVTSTSARRYEVAEIMIGDADQMLYQAKRGGRNRSRAVAV